MEGCCGRNLVAEHIGHARLDGKGFGLGYRVDVDCISLNSAEPVVWQEEVEVEVEETTATEIEPAGKD
jgi:hypothetical protein